MSFVFNRILYNTHTKIILKSGFPTSSKQNNFQLFSLSYWEPSYSSLSCPGMVAEQEHIGQTGQVLIVTGGACGKDWAGSRCYRRSM